MNRENATYALGHVACQSWVLIVTLLSQSEGKHSQASLSSLKCVVPYCRPTSEHGEETDVWTFAVKLSQTLCQRNRKKIPNFANNYLPTSGLRREVIMTVNQTESKVRNNNSIYLYLLYAIILHKTCLYSGKQLITILPKRDYMLLHVMLNCINSIN